MSKVLLLGGTGVMGKCLGQKLSKLGYAVFSTTRRCRTECEGVQYIVGNAQDDAFLASTLSSFRPDAVVDFMSYGTERFAQRRDCLLASTAQYVFLSSCRVFAGEDIHTERSPRLLDVCTDVEYLKTDDYALAKAREENLLRDSGRNNWTIVRPCIAYASPRLQFGCLDSFTFFERVRQGLPVPMPEEMMAKRTTMLHGEDAAEMIARLVLNEKTLGEDYNIVTAENHAWSEVGAIYTKALGMKVVSCSMKDYMSFCDQYQVRYGRMVHHCFDNSKVLSATGLRQEDLHSLATGLAEEAEKCLTRRVPVDLSRNAVIDRVLRTRLHVAGWRNKLFYQGVRYPTFGKMLKAATAIKRRI